MPDLVAGCGEAGTGVVEDVDGSGTRNTADSLLLRAHRQIKEPIPVEVP